MSMSLVDPIHATAAAASTAPYITIKNASRRNRRRLEIIVCAVVLTLVLGNWYISIQLPSHEESRRSTEVFFSTNTWQRPIVSSYTHITPSSSYDHVSTEPQPQQTAASLIQRHVRLSAILASEPVGSSALFVLCDDSSSHLDAYHLFHSVSWVHLYTLPSNDFGSFYFYNLIGHFMNPTFQNWTRFRWIGSLDFSHHHNKHNNNNNDMDTIAAMLLQSKFTESTHDDDDDDIQVLSFSQPSSDSHLIEMKQFFSTTEGSYPGFTRLVEHGLLTVGEPPELIQSVITSINSSSFIYLHSNQFVTQPPLLQSLIPWLSKVLLALFYDHNDINTIDSHLLHKRMNSTIPMSMMIPLLGDFLISYFLNTRGAIIKTLDEYSKPTSDFIRIPFTTPGQVVPLMTPSRKALEETVKRRREDYYNPRNPDPTPLIFILCQDDKESTAATLVYSSYSWAHIYEISTTTTVLEELYFITNHLGDLLHLATFNTHWIGCIPWKDGSLNFNLTRIDQMLGDTILIEDGVNVLIFSSTETTHSTGTMTQPASNIIQQVEYILLSTGETSDSISSDRNRRYSNVHDLYFVTTLDLVRSFIPWISRILIFSQADPGARNDITDWTLLTKHLAAYFFITRGNKIVSMTDYGNILDERQRIKDEQERYKMQNNNMIQSLQAEADGNPLVFVLCHNQYSLDAAKDTYSKFSWAHIYVLHTTFMLEAYFYTNILESLMDATNHTTHWVGSISYQAEGKTYLPTINKMLSDQSLIQDGYDVLAFWTPLYRGDTLRGQSDWFHPGLMEAMEYSLQSVGETQENITRMGTPAPLFNAFYGTFFVCRPALMRQYISWLTRIVIFMNTDPKAQRLIWKNSHYFGTEGVAEKVYGKTFYPFHPFMGERLSSYFFNSRGAKIALVDSATGDYPWYKEER